MEDSISSEQQMLENVRNNTLRSSGSPVKYFKKKNRGKVWKTFCSGKEGVLQRCTLYCDATHIATLQLGNGYLSVCINHAPVTTAGV